MRVLMLPHLSHFRSEESGIRRVVESYFNHLSQFDIELVHPDTSSYDLLATHAGMGDGSSTVAHLHGLYWTADYDCSSWEYEANARIVNDIRHAKQITVPSNWVAESFRRDMRLNPHIIGHGIEWDSWQHSEPNEGYVLWNKNRVGDVCSPIDMERLAQLAPDTVFLSTFGRPSHNIFTTGILSHQKMKQVIQKAGVYLSTTKETFGIGVLEAMAAGVPVLGWNIGGNRDLIQHGVNGYLATDMDDLLEGLRYCQQHRQILGDNGQELAKQYTWQKVCEQVVRVYQLALKDEPATVGVVIPVYNKPIEEVKRAIDSCLNQTLKPARIIVIDDGSEGDYQQVESMGAQDYYPVTLINQSNQGVAIARNNGVTHLDTKYICCLDSDDWLDPRFLETCVNSLESDLSLDIAYTGLHYHKPDGTEGLSPWPGDWSYDDQLKRKNQIPTCCVFRREMWQRLGGYRARYCPQGAGSEDAEFWTRAGAYGFKAEKVTDEGLFHYSWMSGQVTGNPDYSEPDWLAWHPFAFDSQHPFASYATPRHHSHPVRQYDEPLISVVIPVGPGHENEVINALDSIEAQSFKKWEVIVVDDTGLGHLQDLLLSYPYMRYEQSGFKPKGAGYARNRGVELAQAPFLLFLDADDTLKPYDAFTRLLDAWNQCQEGIYTDYVGHSIINPEYAKKLGSRLEAYNPKTDEAIIKHQSYDFDLARILQQPEPNGNIYSWQMITCLFPTQWHFDIGGFDEQMQTWEDWDYWIRMVKAGKRFKRLPEELLRYRFYTSTRRHKATSDTQQGRQMAGDMIKYLVDKHKTIEVVSGPLR